MTVGDVIGDSTISAWRVAPGFVWVQTRSPYYARRLMRRRDSRLAATGAAGGFLRTFELQRPLRWAKRFIDDHQKNQTAPNERFLRPESPTSRRNCRRAESGGRENRTPLRGSSNKKSRPHMVMDV
jgi:hypothetical protein